MIYMNFFLLVPILGLVVWFWILIFKLLIRANKALQIYIDNETKKL